MNNNYLMKRLIGIILVVFLVGLVGAINPNHEYINPGALAIRVEGDYWIDDSSDSASGPVSGIPVPEPEATPVPVVTAIQPRSTPKPAVIVTPAANPTKTIPPIIKPTPSPLPTTTIIPVVNGSVLTMDQFGIKGDGTDETTKLQTALNYARDHSISTVVFPQNKVITITRVITIPAGLTVIGNGSTIKRKPTAPMSGSMISIMDNVYCSGLIVDGSHWDPASPYGYSDNGVRLGSGVTFTGNEIKNVRAYSVGVYEDSNVLITNNKIHDSLQYGIATGGGVGGESHSITVTGNTIYNCQQVGIKIRGTHGAVIRNNNIIMDEFDQFGRGISLYSYDLPNDDILIDGNTITGSFEGGNMDGISSDNSQNTKIRITNNIVRKCDVGIALRFSKGIVSGNKISECSSSITGTNGNTVTGNIVS